jgi:putative transposase
LDHIIAVELIDKARTNGARLKPACDVLEISKRTYQRWTKNGTVKKDQRPIVNRTTPKNKLSKEERLNILKTVNSP